MQPLFEQVYHGCAAGLYDEVFDDVCWGKIYRREEYFLTQKLGAWETALSLVRTFFPGGDLSQVPQVSKKSDQSWLLNTAGLALLNTGRPKEAEEIYTRKLEMNVKEGQWESASAGYRNLADLQFQAGELERAVESARKAYDVAEKAGSEQNIMISKAYLAWILHLAGKGEQAGQEFRQADEIEGKIRGERLYSQRGVRYADFLLSTKQIDEAAKLTRANLEICQRNKWPAVISRCHRCLSAIERLKGNHKEAEAHLQQAIEIARQVGMPALEIEALLESGRLHLDTGRHQEAVQAGNTVLGLCERTGFRLYEPEAELILSRAYLVCKDVEQARAFAQSAYEKADSMGYHQVRVEAEQLL